MSDQEEKSPRKLYFFGYRWHAPVAVLFAAFSIFAVSGVSQDIFYSYWATFVPLVVITWGFGLYFAMSAIMVDSPMLRFIGLMSFGVLEWSCFLLMATVSSFVSHPVFRMLGL